MSVIITPGQAGDNPHCSRCSTRSRSRGTGLDALAVARPDRVLADKAYSHRSTRAALRRRKIAFTSPERTDQITHRQAKGPRGGRPPAFDPDLYRDRSVVERCYNRIKQFRGLATRYAKRAAYYRSELIIVAIVLWLRTGSQDTP